MSENITVDLLLDAIQYARTGRGGRGLSATSLCTVGSRNSGRSRCCMLISRSC